MTFPARAKLPRRCPRAEGAPRRAGPPGRAATTTAAVRPGRGPAARISGDSRLLPGLMAPVTLPLSPPVSGALPRARRPNRSLRGSRQRSPGRTGSRRPRSGSRRAAHTFPGRPRPPRRPDAPLVPGVRLGAGSRPGRAWRPRHQTGGRELGRPPRAAAGDGALLSGSRGSDPGGPEGRPCSRANLGI